MNRQQLFLKMAQRRAETRMPDTCEIKRQSGTVRDDESGTRVPSYTTLYTGKCRVQQNSGMPASSDVGQDFVLLLTLEVQLPMSVTGLKVDDRIQITTSLDPDLIGRTFLIRGLAHKTEASARRVQCTERTGS